MNCKRSLLAILIVGIWLCLPCIDAHAWDSRTHMLIARLAIDALPESPLKRVFETHAADLQDDAVAPDEVFTVRTYGTRQPYDPRFA